MAHRNSHHSSEGGTATDDDGHQEPAKRPQVEGLRVDSGYLRLLVGAKEGTDPFALEAACSEAGISALRRWFNAVGERFRETHLLSLLRRCTDMGDARILDAFDLLDSDGRGCISFSALHLLVCILAGRAEGRLKRFLYMRGKDSFIFLAAGSTAGDAVPQTRSGAGRSRVKSARLFKFLAVFGFDQYVVAKLHEQQLAAKKQMTESEVSLFLFSICQQHDLDYAELQLDAQRKEGGHGDYETPKDDEDAEDVETAKTARSRLCVIS